MDRGHERTGIEKNFVNPRKPGAVKIVKTAKNVYQTPAAPTSDTPECTSPTSTSAATPSDGSCLPKVKATASASSCSSSDAIVRYVTNTPLSRIKVEFESSAGTGITAVTSVSCWKHDDTGKVAPLSALGTWSSYLLPDTYDCTIVIDP